MGKPNDDNPRDALRNCVVHIFQLGEQIAEATRQRGAHVAAGDLALVRRTNKHIDDLKSDLAALAEGRALIEQRVAQLDSEERLAAADSAIETLRPLLEELCAMVERMEGMLVEAGNLKSEIDKRYEAFRLGIPINVPRLPAYSDFTLAGLNARLQQALTDCAREDISRMDYLIDDVTTGERRRPSRLLRARVEAFVNDLRAKVREVEETKAHAAAE
jgi:hypothetical protein